MADTVELPPDVLAEVADRLAEKRMGVDKEVKSIGEAPSSLKDVFELCRGFEKAFSMLLNSKNLTQKDTPTAAKIKDCFMSEKGLAGQISRLQLDDLFKLDNVKRVCKQADGYQPHLVSPEKGLRLLASEALARVETPVKVCVSTVSEFLVMAARDAADQAGGFVEGVAPGLKEPVQVPAFKQMVMPAVSKALEDWRDDAEKMALMLVDMERSYITAGFFRYTMDRRLRKSNAPAKSDKPPPTRMTALKNKFMRKKEDEPEEDDDTSSVSYTPAGRTPATNAKEAAPAPPPPGGDLVAAYFEKSQNEGTFLGRGWQKRFFIYKHSMKTLYYFKSAEDVQKPDGLKGQVLISECIVEDIDEKGNLRNPRAAPESVYLRIRHRDPSRAAVKDNNSLVLKAEKLDQKSDWLAMLQRASGYVPPEASPSRSQSRRNTEDGSGGGGSSKDAGEEGAEEEKPEEVVEEKDDQQDAMWEPYVFSEGTFAAATHLGEGAPIFRAENVRDAEGRLLPASGVVLGRKYNTDPRKAETPEARYDQLLDQFGEDMCVYIRMVCDTITHTVPKAVIHSMVKRAETHLLNRLFQHVHDLSEPEMKRLLEEDEMTVSRRQAAKKALEDIQKSIDLVHHMQEEVHLKQSREPVKVPGHILAYAGLLAYVPRDKQPAYRRMIESPYAPKTLREEFAPKTDLAALAAAAKQAAKQAAAAASSAVSGAVGRTSSSGSSSLARPSMSLPAGARGSEPLRRPPPPPPGMR